MDAIKGIFEKEIERIEEYILSREKDLYFSDSWEQCAQIRSDIQKNENYISVIKGFLNDRCYDKRVFDVIRKNIIRRKRPCMK